MRDEAKPWLQPTITRFLEGVILCPDMTVFEWGMGWSTVWLADRVGHVTSVEHDKDWFDRIPRRENMECMLIPPDRGVIRAIPADPRSYFSDDERWRNHNFRRYASIIDDLGPFDLIFVDGRARPSCLMHGRERLKPCGFLVLDDANREYYLWHTRRLFREWSKFSFYEKKQETVIWRKPQESRKKNVF